MTPDSIIKTIREYKDSDAETKKPLTRDEVDALVSIFTDMVNSSQKK